MVKHKKKKIIFILPDLVSGGAERVMSFVAKNISKEQFDVSLWAAGYEKNTKYDVSGLNVVYFNKPRVLKAIPNFFFALLKTKPDIVISSITHLNTAMGLLSPFFPNTKFIGREANVLSVKKNFNNGKKKFYSHIPLSKISYRYLDIILCQSNDMYNDMKTNFGISDNKLRLINNPITDNFKLKTNKETTSNLARFITVARLKKQKGHERIIHALSKLNFPYEYTIIGDGPEKEKLFALAKELNVYDKINHIPSTQEVSKYLAKSDLFIQGAYVEGFPNCLIESCAVGTPIVAYNAPGGLDEIIEEEVNGFVSENEEEFINNIIKSIKSHTWSPEIIRNSVTKKFSKEKIIKDYENLFFNILNQKNTQ